MSKARFSAPWEWEATHMAGSGTVQMPRMVVTDLDGTLLRPDRTLPEGTCEMIARLRGRGIRFAIATARPIRGVKAAFPELTYDAALFHNGAVVQAEGRNLAGFGVPDAQGLIRSIQAQDPDARICAEAEDCLYSCFDPGSIWPGIEYVPTSDFHELALRSVDKIIVEAHTLEEAERIGRILPDGVYAQLSEHRIAMIMNRSASKENGVARLAGYFGMPLEAVAAFGDDYNDIGMLRRCGIGIATANALNEVKGAADEICASNADDGVLKWLAEHL